MALREFLRVLERNGELHRTSVEIDPALELTEISVRALREDKPALYIERPTGSAYPAVVNHFSSSRRIELALGKHPDQLGGELITFLEQAFSPTIAHLFEHRSTVKRMLNARPRTVRRARSQYHRGNRVQMGQRPAGVGDRQVADIKRSRF